MNDNDILIARKTEGGSRSVVVDGDTVDFDRQNRRVRERKNAEEAKRKEEAAYHKWCQEQQAAMERAEQAKRRRHVHMGIALVLSVGALMAMTMAGLIHTVVGMAFIAGDAAVCGWFAGRNC